MSVITRDARGGQSSGTWTRLAPLSGIGFIVCFIGGVVSSSPPDVGATNAKWIAEYATTSKQWGHLATGVLLILAALFLICFFSTVWARIATAQQPRLLNPLPLLAAAVGGACMAAGGLCMAVISGAELTSSNPLIGDADMLRLGNALGFGLAGIAGMAAISLAILSVSIQAHAAGVFGTKLLALSVLVAVVLLAAFLFVPIIALMLWLVVVAVVLVRRPEVDVVPAT